ncbi:beta-glucosidase [Gordonia sp. TBRC 11910]|uniref:Exo-alpha-(1->6)-L-arabinopyranosidase n=1 Tax=Gordonia asplenii TaxID=2725283 RepID=A0A848KV06_9ACTN|nr:glycoside hydrolase family 3 C-terminal domain-containing protein [Gordonia asplenii]NMO02089.1 beta-glucosidase [Gordonia asplenii]
MPSTQDTELTTPAALLPTARERIADLDLAAKAALTTGASFWFTTSDDAAGIPAVMLTDGPHGIRKQIGDGDALGLNNSVVAICFPPAVAMASSFDAGLIARVGDALGAQCVAESIGVLLGPGINIKRSLLGGRNFEYMSEDPYLTGRLAASLVAAVQAHGVGTSLKHFAANNQETERLRVSADIDPRPLHEIYLRAFEHVVRTAAPWTIMASYNKINGEYATQSRWLLTETLRDRWGFDGLVVSDWAAVDDRVAALAAGLDLEMPANPASPAAVVRAVEAGQVPYDALDDAAARVAALGLAASANARSGADYDRASHHALAREVAARCAVLLRNDGAVLPLTSGTRVAVIGEFARTPRFQGGGSSKVNPFQVDAALDAIVEYADGPVTFAPGFVIGETASTPELIDEAATQAGAADVAVVFVGLGERDESEGFDRTGWTLPAAQIELLDAVTAANPRTVVVVSNGSVVDLAPTENAAAVVEAWLLGEASGAALADVLYGLVDPSGRLAETIPLRIEDSPAFLDFPGEHLHVRYGEGVFVGYRWYDARNLPVRYPFGHGLSYTTMTFDHVAASLTDDGIAVDVRVTNTGSRTGRAVVQVYVGVERSAVARAPRELKGIETLELAAGASMSVRIDVPRSELAYWNRDVDDWFVEDADYRVDVGSSSRDIKASSVIHVDGDAADTAIGLGSTILEVLDHPVIGPRLGEMFGALSGDGTAPDPTLLELAGSFPIGRVAPILGMTREQMSELLQG